jgi:hypothetical protein
MSEMNIDPNLVIADLLDQIKKLSGDNAVLRSVITQLQNSGTEDTAAIVPESDED